MNFTLKSVWSCTVFKKSTSLFIPNVIPTSLMQGYITLKIQVVLKACHSLQSYLISREPSTSNYLTLTSCWIKWSLRSDRYSKHIQGKCGTANKSWALLQKEHRGSRRDSKQREGWLGSRVDSWAGSKGWARPGLDLSLSPGSLSPCCWLQNVLWMLLPEGTGPFDDSLFLDSRGKCLKCDDIQGCVY